MLRYLTAGESHGKSLTDILDRASARETAARVAVGSVCRKLLDAFGIRIFSYVREIGAVKARAIPADPDEIIRRTEASPVRCPDPEAEKAMMAATDKAKE